MGTTNSLGRSVYGQTPDYVRSVAVPVVSVSALVFALDLALRSTRARFVAAASSTALGFVCPRAVERRVDACFARDSAHLGVGSAGSRLERARRERALVAAAGPGHDGHDAPRTAPSLSVQPQYRALDDGEVFWRAYVDLRESIEVSIVQIGLETAEIYE